MQVYRDLQSRPGKQKVPTLHFELLLITQDGCPGFIQDVQLGSNYKKKVITSFSRVLYAIERRIQERFPLNAQSLAKAAKFGKLHNCPEDLLLVRDAIYARKDLSTLSTDEIVAKNFRLMNRSKLKKKVKILKRMFKRIESNGVPSTQPSEQWRRSWGIAMLDMVRSTYARGLYHQIMSGSPVFLERKIQPF